MAGALCSPLDSKGTLLVTPMYLCSKFPSKDLLTSWAFCSPIPGITAWSLVYLSWQLSEACLPAVLVTQLRGRLPPGDDH